MRKLVMLALMLAALSARAAPGTEGAERGPYAPYAFLIGEWLVAPEAGGPAGTVVRFRWGPGHSYMWYSASLLMGGAERPHFEGILMWNGVHRNLDMLLTLDLDGGRVQEQGTVSVAADGTVIREITAYYSEGVGMITTGKRTGPEGGVAHFRQTFKAQTADRVLTSLMRESDAGWVPTFPGSDHLAMVRRDESAPLREGRWTGRAHLPGRDVKLVVDLAQDASGAWIGSIVIPGFDVAGAPLQHVSVAADAVSFDVGDALSRPPDSPASFTAKVDAKGLLSGEMKQGGNAAPFQLARTGAAQVQMPRRSTAIAKALEGRWIGEYELGGYTRHVTVDIANANAAPPSIDFVVVGKQATKLPIDFVAEEEGLLRIECNAYRLSFEGRLRGDRIEGTFEQTGFLEVPLILRRPEKAS